MKRETKEKYEQLSETARELISKIQKLGYTPNDIAREMDGRVSYRTLYRWMNQEAQPQRESDVVALAKVYKTFLKKSQQ